MNITAIRVEHLREPLGVGTDRPRLSWQVEDVTGAWRQTGYDVAVRDADTSSPATVHHVESGEQVLVPWPGEPVPSRGRREVRVRVRGTAADETVLSEWSEPIVVETGLLASSDWQAQLIQPEPDASGPLPRPAILLRGVITLKDKPTRARWYVTAQGLYEGEINGRRVGRDELAPGWTSYHHRLRYQTYDVTNLLERGANVLGAWLADGWFRGYIGFEGGRRNYYGRRTGLLAQLEVAYTDGSHEVFGTDESWRSAESPIYSTGLYEGEAFDAREVRASWSSPGADTETWGGVVTGTLDPSTLLAPAGPPVRCTEELVPKEVITTPSGKTILDFGQNIAGRLRIRVSGEHGTVVTLRHAEVLDHGELGTRPLRLAAVTDTYTLAGGDTEVWEPRFTVHGFRYAQVDGWPGDLDASAIVARVIHSDMERTGWWQSSNPMLNRLHENVRWGMRGNFVDVPTDCPQRDERLGWTGDIAVFAPTACYLYDCRGFLTSWLQDLAAEQVDLSTVPIYVPYVALQFPLTPFAIWGDAAITVPWDLYRSCGDLDVLRRQYPSMVAWLEQVDSLAGPTHVWAQDLQLGDWLDPAAPPDEPAKAMTPAELVATAYFARSAALLAVIASLLGKSEDAHRFSTLAQQIRAAFNAEYVTASGRMLSDSQTAYSLALAFDLIGDAGQREHAAKRLATIVAESSYHIGTGFAGTPVVCDALARSGHIDDAYHLLLTDTCPSWLYPVTMGATTVWERWDSMLPDGSINPGDMTSFNHYALGAIADFLHRVVGGLAALEPGYRTFAVEPRPGGGLTTCSTRHQTPYGLAAVEWERADGQLRVEVIVPAGTSARVTLPAPEGGAGAQAQIITAGRHSFAVPFRAPADDPARPEFVHPLDEAFQAAAAQYQALVAGDG